MNRSTLAIAAVTLALLAVVSAACFNFPRSRELCFDGGRCIPDPVVECDGGGCSTEGCAANEINCGDGCIDVLFNVNSCGACGRVCDSTQACIDGRCTCTPATCKSGCCDANGQCRTDSANDSCGLGGTTCSVCESGQTCIAGECACTPGSCPDGCCINDTCFAGNEQNACGKGGGPCRSCVGRPCADQECGCVPGDVQQDIPCGNRCGKTFKTCLDSGFWSPEERTADGGCPVQSPTACVPNETRPFTCGPNGGCGSGQQTCNALCKWVVTSDCQGGSCSPGSTSSQSCGRCNSGSQSRTCSEDCSWGGYGTCGGETGCSPGAVEFQNCGDCGAQGRTCDSSCNWGAWGTCNGPNRACPNANQTCTSSGTCVCGCTNGGTCCNNPALGPICGFGNAAACGSNADCCSNNCIEDPPGSLLFKCLGN